ncbi:hypothetical protein JW921_03910 [Candidatus Fermentibacterales bacterium]|nr:hypothetical protein [Candidatus Fermentibacterales bacterium]
MRSTGAVILTIGMLTMPSPRASSGAEWFLDLESGGAFPGYNDVRVPGETGTDISVTGDLETDAAVFFRARGGVTVGDRHTLSALVAPLTLEASGSVGFPVLFGDVEFDAATPLEATYRFDSYRISYSYRFIDNGSLRLDAGLTAKIRDAEIRLEGGGQTSSTANTGFVPLIRFALAWRVGPSVEVLLDGDALVGPQGRAEDVFAGVGVGLCPRLVLRAGYRLLEGGADVEQVYNFTMVNYAAVGITAML